MRSNCYVRVQQGGKFDSAKLPPAPPSTLHSTPPLTYEQTKEGPIVGVTYTVVNPRTMVVHAQHASVTHTAVVGAGRLAVAALLAEARGAVLHRVSQQATNGDCPSDTGNGLRSAC